MKIEVITKEEFLELKTMMQKILDLLGSRNNEIMTGLIPMA
jgi:hypothetical protein